jgi:hypothetical protein
MFTEDLSEQLLSAMNVCILVGYVAGCSMEGIELEQLRIETEGDINYVFAVAGR